MSSTTLLLEAGDHMVTIVIWTLVVGLIVHYLFSAFRSSSSSRVDEKEQREQARRIRLERFAQAASSGGHSFNPPPAPAPTPTPAPGAGAGADADATDSTTGTKSPIKKTSPSKNKIKSMPAPQILCEAMSVVTRCVVTVEQLQDGGTLGGQGWTLRKQNSNVTGGTLVLPLYKFSESNNKSDSEINQNSTMESGDGEWIVVLNAWKALLNSSKKKYNPFLKELHQDIRRAAVFCGRAQNIQRIGLSFLAHQGQLPEAMGLFCRFVAHQAAQWIQPHVSKALLEQGQDEDNELDLFSDDYNHDDQAISVPLQAARNPWESFLNLMEEPGLVVTKPFLDDLTQAYREQQEQEDANLPQALLQCLLDRLAQCWRCKAPSSVSPHDRITALSRVLGTSPEACACLASRMQEENRHKDLTGAELEHEAWLRPMLCMTAYVVPEAGEDQAQRGSSSSLFSKHLLETTDYPLGVFQRKNKDVHKVMESSQAVMRAARIVSESFLRKLSVIDKQNVFAWISRVVQANDALADMLMGDLLSPDGVAAVSSSRCFLLGLASTLAGFAVEGLQERFAKLGVAAFDVTYLQSDWLDISSDERRLVPSNRMRDAAPKTQETVSSKKDTFSGSTHLFFLSAALQRVSLFPALRIQSEMMSKYRQLLVALQDMANSSTHEALPPPGLLKAAQPAVAAWLGFNCFLEERDFVIHVTNLSLLQLKWLIALVLQDDKNNAALGLVPEWMCKLPATWLAHVAHHSPRLLKPYQADQAVQYTTELLGLGTTGNGVDDGQSLFSPIAVTCLIRIASAFVDAGVQRAARRQQLRRRRPKFGDDMVDEDSDEDDTRNLDVYLSFDQNDLGVTVFTNQLVRTKLCPTLLHTFNSLDAVEGLDVDKEFHFDKFQVRAEIADLFLRLWCHPDGECRLNAVKQLERGETTSLVEHFAVTVAASVGYVLDDACHRLADLCSLQKGRQSPETVQFFERQAESCAGFLQMARRFLLLLCHVSQEPVFAAVFGGSSNTTAKQKCSAQLATMVIHFIDKLTISDGSTHPDIDFRKSQTSTLSLAHSHAAMSTVEKRRETAELLRAREFARYELGMDVANLTHQLLALAARWHGGVECSLFLTALASNDDCNVEHLRNVFGRLVLRDSVSEHFLFLHDGYGDRVPLKSDDGVKSDPQSRGRRRRARQDQVSRSDIDLVASCDDIAAFLDDLECAMAANVTKSKEVLAEEIPTVQRAILTSEGCSSDDEYGSYLGDWTVSSESFLMGPEETTFAHFYDTNARARGIAGSGKVLIKEAKRIQRALPVPHPNSAAFVCFSEERMDLCRAVITGPVDTPYAHGIFSFDVLYSQNHPHTPPLVTFTTTGGGQTRFNPNLYQDGKVCLSLLGTWHAADESQRWNPAASSLAQVLLSIQTQLLVAEPYFNEPGYESSQGTQAGRNASARYNLNLKLATLRHAINGQLREPPKGFEAVTLRHFGLCRKRILIQARLWTLEAKGTAMQSRFERAYAELLGLLSADEFKRYDALPPLAADLRALERMDPDIVRICSSCRTVVETSNKDHRNSASARSGSATSGGVSIPDVGTDFNPWAAPHASAGVQSTHYAIEENRDDPDDELYC